MDRYWKSIKSRREFSRDRVFYSLAILVLASAGFVLRLRKLLFSRSLWLDEAALAMNILHKTPGELFGQLDYGQVAPFGFMLITKFFSLVFGTGEISLRLFPFVAGIASLVGIVLLSRSLVSKYGTLFALAIFSVSPPLIQYSSELKPYSSDVAVTLGLLLAVMRYRNATSRWYSIAYVALGVISVWISYPALFVVASIGVVDTSLTLIANGWKPLRSKLLTYGAWAISSIGVIVQSSAARARLASLDHWGGAFMPFPPNGLQDLEWFLDRYLGLFDDALGIPTWSGVAALVLLGFLYLTAARTRRNLLLAGIIPFLLFASALEVYPVADRAILFLAGPLAVWLVASLDGVFKESGFIKFFSLLIIGALLMWSPIQETYKLFRVPARQEEMRDVVEYLKPRIEKGDHLYVYYGAEPAFRYYSERLDLTTGSWFFGERARQMPKAYLEELTQFTDERRLWLVFSHDHYGKYGNERDYILEFLNCLGHQQLEYRRPGAHLYLYDLERTSESAAGVSECMPSD